MESKRSDAENIKNSIRDQLLYIGEDPDREGLIETPNRVLKSWEQLYAGYNLSARDLMVTFKDGACQEMILLKNCEFFSTCEHHMLPFFGKIHIAYLPKNKVIGVSKLARLAEIYSRRLQIQERLVTQIANCIDAYLQPAGVMVVCEAQHFCMTARGVQKQNSIMVTSALRGSFMDNNALRQEFLFLIKG